MASNFNRNIRNPAANALSEPAKTGLCAASGCPLPGTICGSTHPGPSASWFCRHHFGADPRDWPHITEMVRRSGERPHSKQELDDNMAQEASDFCDKKGLKTVQDMINFCKGKGIGTGYKPGKGAPSVQD